METLSGPAAIIVPVSEPGLNREELLSILHQRMEEFFVQRGGFSGVVLAMQGGEVILSETFGMANPDLGTYNTLDTPFTIGFITQIFTGAAVLMLEMEGKLDTTDTLDNFFSGHNRLSDITVADLLAMDGGFGGSTPLASVFISEPDEIREMTPLELEPYVISRLNWQEAVPNNLDYWVLGRIIEQVSGISYEEFIKTRIFDHLGMENSGVADIHGVAAPLGIPIRFFEAYSNIMNSGAFPFFLYYSSSGLMSSANDLNIYLDAFFGGELFPEYMLEQIQKGDYNYGWIFHESGGWYMLGQSFGSSVIIYHPKNNTSIIVLSNLFTGNREAEILGSLMAEILIGTPIFFN